MTDFPSPSGRPKTAKSLAFALFRPVLFAIGAIVLALGGLVLTHRSNPEIAQGLYVSVKTLETHLSSAYRKLGARSRTELTRIFATHPLDGAKDGDRI